MKKAISGLSVVALSILSACGQPSGNENCSSEFVTDHNRLGSTARSVQTEQDLADLEKMVDRFEQKYPGMRCQAAVFSSGSSKNEEITVDVSQKVAGYRAVIASAKQPTPKTTTPKPDTYVLTAAVDSVCSNDFVQMKKVVEDAQEYASDVMNDMRGQEELPAAKAALENAEENEKTFTAAHGTTDCTMPAVGATPAAKVSGKVLSEAFKRSNEVLRAQFESLKTR
ncbi:MAG: hypothetical protein JNL01_05290 [Bdellovibrionales bacterium]|nr:hypothetical protein [Bdellovibrionales bacterium]